MNTQEDLATCPFCGTEMYIESNRDWHRLKGDHDDECVFEIKEEAMTVSATKENLAWMIAVWNRRSASNNEEQKEPERFFGNNIREAIQLFKKIFQ
ncbi:MAG: hypothetical protein KAJ19_23995 [Gammaproteobacteria bacterium]|nr:hypothetical protein [Gammaproteobacteria bacterium]